MTLTAEEIEPAESELTPRIGSIAPATRINQASETHRASPEIAVANDVVKNAEEGQTLESLLIDNGSLSPDSAFRIVLGICDAVRSARQQGELCGTLTPERIIVRSDGAIRLAQSCNQLGRGEQIDYVAALNGLFCKMVIGRFPSTPSDYRELTAQLSPRLRRIVLRSANPDATKQYAVLDDYACALKREERIQFYRAVTLLLVLFGFALGLHMIRHTK